MPVECYLERYQDVTLLRALEEETQPTVDDLQKECGISEQILYDALIREINSKGNENEQHDVEESSENV